MDVFLEGYGFHWIWLTLFDPVSFLAFEIQAEWSNMVNAFKLFQTFTSGNQKIEYILDKQIHFQEAYLSSLGLTIYISPINSRKEFESLQHYLGAALICKKELWVKLSS